MPVANETKYNEQIRKIKLQDWEPLGVNFLEENVYIRGHMSRKVTPLLAPLAPLLPPLALKSHF